LFSSLLPPPPPSTLFPYTTLFRSSAPPVRTAVPEWGLWPLATRGEARVSRPPRHSGQGQWLPDRDRGDRKRPVARARRPRGRGRRHGAGRPRQAPGGLLFR